MTADGACDLRHDNDVENKRLGDTMLNRSITHVPVRVTAVLLFGSMLASGTGHAQALVKVTPIGSW